MSIYSKDYKTRTISIFNLIFIMSIFCLSFVFVIAGNQITVRAEGKEQLFKNEAIINNFNYLCEIEKKYRENNTEVMPTEMVAYLENKILELKNESCLQTIFSNDSSIGDNNYSIFGMSATSAEIALVIQYPAQAIIAFNASQDAVGKISNFYNSNDGAWLNNADAFRHAFWNALMEKRISKDYSVNTGTLENPNYEIIQIDFAKLFADAHEYGNTGVDSEMDLKNNAIGRSDGSLFGGLSENELAFKIMERISLGHYWKVANYQEIDGEINGELVASDSAGLLPEIFDNVMFETTIIDANKIIIDKINWLINGEYIVPLMISNKEVVGLGSTAFSNQTQLTSVMLPPTVTSIGENTFLGCTNLMSINLGGTQTIGSNAFQNCTKLASITNFDSVTLIGETAFLNCTGLTTITISSTVVDVGGGAFAGCNNLVIHSNNSNFVADGNILYNSNKSKIITTGKISSEIKLSNAIIEIGRYAFYNNINLTDIEINEFVYIRSYAFANCLNLNSVTINSTIVPSLEPGSFNNAYFSLYVPSGYEDDYYEAFSDYASNVPIYEKKYEIVLLCSLTGQIVDVAEAYFLCGVTLTHIPSKEHYEMEGVYDLPNGQGDKYVSIEYNAATKKLEAETTGNYWQQHSSGILYINWERISEDVTCSAVANNSVISNPTVHIVSGIDSVITAPTISGYTFDHWTIYGTNDTNVSITIKVTLHRSYTTGKITLVGTEHPTQDDYITIYYNKVEESCVAKGTLITLADGSQVPVENLTGSERLLVWNLKTGSFDTAPILFIDSEPYKHYDIINLYFSDGTHVKVIDEHAFYDFNLNKYVYLRSDASNYIGHYFNKQVVDENGNLAWARVQLTNVTITNEYTMAYSPVTETHLCLYVNGMLSMPGGIEGLVNTFEVDGDTMQIDQAKYLEDIETYGLFTYEEFYELYPVPKYMFDAVDGANLKVALAKGLLTHEELSYLIERYSEFFV